MRLVRNVALAAGACVVAAGSGTAAPASVTAAPDVPAYAGARSAGPPTTAQCQQRLGLACYQPDQIRKAYGLDPLYARGIDGKGTTIVIVDSYGSPAIAHDLRTFDAAFGLPTPPSFQVIQPAGPDPSWDPPLPGMAGWAAETTLDVEWAHAVAPGASIVLAETPVNETEGVHGFPQIVAAEKYVLSHYHADVISQSFGATEQTFPGKASVQSLRGAILAAYRDHVTMLAGSGDTGATAEELNGFDLYPYPVTTWEPSDPLVTAVGGTQLHLNAAGDRTQPDSVWNDTGDKAVCGPLPCPDAGGGGTSIFFGRPGYQDGVADVTGDHRGVPDIAMSAACDGAVDVYLSFPAARAGWTTSCGTSEATPLLAGVIALAAQYAGHPLGLINPALYEMSEQHLPGIVPVTQGDNSVTFQQDGQSHTVRGFHAGPVYSLAAGVGTIDAQYFVPELARLDSAATTAGSPPAAPADQVPVLVLLAGLPALLLGGFFLARQRRTRAARRRAAEL